MIRVQEAGPLGRRFFINTRLALRWTDSDSHVLRRGADHRRQRRLHRRRGPARRRPAHPHVLAGSPISTTCGAIHSWRAGIQFDGGTYRSDDASNYLGTYTFESLAAYEAGRPRTYTRRIGDPNISY